MRIVRADVPMVRAFLDVAGSSLNRFRYYGKRDPAVAMRAHVCTLVGFEDSGAPIAYGHLDRDGDVVWLGICVAYGRTDRGLGTKMLSALLSVADADHLTVDLGLDPNNTSALRLYRRFGFTYVDARDGLIFMRRKEVRMDTAGSLVDKLCTVDQKLFHNQDLLYEIRRMTFEEFRAKYMSDEGMQRLWDVLKKACDLNVQRHQLIEEFDKKLLETVRAVASGNGDAYIQPQHKTYSNDGA